MTHTDFIVAKIASKAVKQIVNTADESGSLLASGVSAAIAALAVPGAVYGYESLQNDHGPRAAPYAAGGAAAGSLLLPLLATNRHARKVLKENTLPAAIAAGALGMAGGAGGAFLGAELKERTSPLSPLERAMTNAYLYTNNHSGNK